MVEQSLAEERQWWNSQQWSIQWNNEWSSIHNGEPLLDDWVFPDDFTSEQLELFNARLSEGYDQFADTDYSYMRWLEQYHPEALPPDRYTLSVSDVFSSVSLLTPVDNADTPTTSSGSSLRTKDQPTKAISSGSAVKEGTSGKADSNYCDFHSFWISEGVTRIWSLEFNWRQQKAQK